MLWISDGLPGSTHDLTAARQHGVIDAAIRHGLQLWADRGYQGEAPTLITPGQGGQGQALDPSAMAYNRPHAAARASGERSFATLKCWQILTRVRCTASKTGAIAQAILALHQHDIYADQDKMISLAAAPRTHQLLRAATPARPPRVFGSIVLRQATMPH
ncbi:transposase family protein [Catellatospora methionotrophica]|uniref:transposase family protein n=1 Tax=Catellatospora methionotrophica TaxID=121620 RepID=UPI0033DA86C1